MITNKFGLGIALLLVLLNTSCDRQRIYDDYMSIPKSGWSKDSIASFNVPINKPELGYNVYINIRNTIDYDNSNLWLFLDATSPGGKVERDTVECLLADPKGKWYGRGWGGVHHLRLPYKFNVNFKEKGNYTFRIQQGMRAQTLKGIQDIGLRVELVKD